MNKIDPKDLSKFNEELKTLLDKYGLVFRINQSIVVVSREVAEKTPDSEIVGDK